MWLKYLQAETYQEEITNDTHGKSGPIKVSFAKSEVNVAEDFLRVALQYDKDRGAVDDVNTLYECNAYGVRLHSLRS
jgi:alcohol oxidase